MVLAAAPAAAQVSVLPVTPAVEGFSPHIVVTGLSPGAAVRVHAYGSFGHWDEDKALGRWVETFKTYHAWADVKADRHGRVDMDRYRVTSGTYRGADGYGLLWSMRKPTDPDVTGAAPNGPTGPNPKPGTTALLVTQGKRVVGHGKLTYVDPPDLTVVPVADGRLNGVFAAPAGVKRLPTIILLHGSEGGGAAEAHDQAVRFAGKGYAA
ncbi:MAG: acyl-CoA thioesterase/BAAT N-terminal domain-containing protein, partial [Pseudomonadota bacterium]